MFRCCFGGCPTQGSLFRRPPAEGGGLARAPARPGQLHAQQSYPPPRPAMLNNSALVEEEGGMPHLQAPSLPGQTRPRGVQVNVR